MTIAQGIPKAAEGAGPALAAMAAECGDGRPGVPVTRVGASPWPGSDSSGDASFQSKWKSFLDVLETTGQQLGEAAGATLAFTGSPLVDGQRGAGRVGATVSASTENVGSRSAGQIEVKRKIHVGEELATSKRADTQVRSLRGPGAKGPGQTREKRGQSGSIAGSNPSRRGQAKTHHSRLSPRLGRRR